MKTILIHAILPILFLDINPEGYERTMDGKAMAVLAKLEPASEPAKRIDLLGKALSLAMSVTLRKSLYCRRAETFQTQGAYKRAAADLKSALRLDPDLHDVRDALAWIQFYNLGELDSAVENFRKVAEDPGAPKAVRSSAYNGWAEVHRHRKQIDKAIEIHEAGLALRPTCLGYHNLAWMVNTHKREFSKAIDFARRALELDPRYDYGRVSLAVFLANASQFEEAKRIIDELKAYGALEPVMGYNLACYYCAVGDPDEALKWIRIYFNKYHKVVRKRNEMRKMMLENWHLKSLRKNPEFMELMKMEEEQD
jgi:tetratricopeptide (TPR) repeat protein